MLCWLAITGPALASSSDPIDLSEVETDLAHVLEQAHHLESEGENKAPATTTAAAAPQTVYECIKDNFADAHTDAKVKLDSLNAALQDPRYRRPGSWMKK